MTDHSSNSSDPAMKCALSSAEHDALRRGLRNLDDTLPPRAVWQRIEQQARAEGLFEPRHAGLRKWFAGAGLAAAVVLAVLNIPFAPLNDDARVEFPTEPEYVAVDGEELPALNALMVRSRQIEKNLRALPEQPSLVRASTAATISELEDQVAAIDFVLAHPDLRLSPEQQEIYWRERVRLMNSLLHLRAAQAQRMSF
ncbi:MAG: hypothetical protein R3192_00860 [Woeseiaceae bacterium]|nr:hypothetical protein [Woeseiaceae bacterium]